MRSLECYFGVYFLRCCATREINTKITLSWTHKQFATRVHTLFYIYWMNDKNHTDKFINIISSADEIHGYPLGIWKANQESHEKSKAWNKQRKSVLIAWWWNILPQWDVHACSCIYVRDITKVWNKIPARFWNPWLPAGKLRANCDKSCNPSHDVKLKLLVVILSEKVQISLVHFV